MHGRPWHALEPGDMGCNAWREQGCIPLKSGPAHPHVCDRNAETEVSAA